MRSTLLGDHQDTTESYYSLGLANSDMANLNAALESFQKSLQMMKCGMGDYKGALESLQKALQLGKKLSTGNQPGIADISSKIYRRGVSQDERL